MAQIEKYFDGISEAFDAIDYCLDEGALSRKDADQIQDILAEIKPTLPAFEYALKLYNQEPKLVIDKRELAFACGELCEKVMRINAISSFGKWDTDGHSYESRFGFITAIQYLLWVLPHAHQKLCRYSHRK